MPSDAAAALSSMLRAATIDDHEEALKLANTALKADGSDIRWQRVRVVALLKLDRFQDAVQAVTDGGHQLRQLCHLELAYALYKAGKLDEATDVLKRAEPHTARHFQHLAAQVAYRAERFGDALDIYRHLMRESGMEARDGEENDVLVNSLASLAQQRWLGTGHGEELGNTLGEDGDEDSFEVAYNRACWCIARGDLMEASAQLRRALRLCDTSDDLSEEEKSAERLPLVIQHAYVLAKLGRRKDALVLHDSVAVSREKEAETAALADTNLSVLKAAEENPFLTQRKMKSVASSDQDKISFQCQMTLQRRNRYTVDLLVNKFSGVQARASKALQDKPHPSISAELNNISAIRAAARSKNHTGKAARRDTLSLLNEQPNDVGLLLTAMQLYLDADNISAASSLLEAFFRRQEHTPGTPAADVRYSPGLVALAAGLYRAQGRLAFLKAELAASSAHWRSRGSDGARALTLLREAGVELMKSSKPEERAAAGSAFAALHAKQSRDPVAEAGVVACFAATDPEKAEPCLVKLPSVDNLISGVDARALMEGGVALGPQSRAPIRKRASEERQERPAKKRKRKLPKDYEEGKVMDPERWLPLRDRSSYRPKGRKAKKKAQESMQGGMVKDEETLELVGGAGAVRVEKAPAASSSSKKKKKGKR